MDPAPRKIFRTPLSPQNTNLYSRTKLVVVSSVPIQPKATLLTVDSHARLA